MEVIGWLGSIFFAICCIPQAFMSYRKRDASNISWLFLVMWILAEVCSIVAMIGGGLPWSTAIMFNYILNSCCLVVILYVKVKYVD